MSKTDVTSIYSLTEFLQNVSFKLLVCVLKFRLEMPRASKNYFGFVVSELELMKSLILDQKKQKKAGFFFSSPLPRNQWRRQPPNLPANVSDFTSRQLADCALTSQPTSYGQNSEEETLVLRLTVAFQNMFGMALPSGIYRLLRTFLAPSNPPKSSVRLE